MGEAARPPAIREQAELKGRSTEEWKWRGVSVWYHDRMIRTGETYRNVVKMTFAKAAPNQPARGPPGARGDEYCVPINSKTLSADNVRSQITLGGSDRLRIELHYIPYRCYSLPTQFRFPHLT